VPAADRRRQLGDVLDLLPDRIPRIVLVQMLEDGARREFQVAARKLVGQLFGIGRQVSEGSEFDQVVAGRGDLVKKAGMRGLAGVVGKPDAP
jgi:hypothetical protein